MKEIFFFIYKYTWIGAVLMCILFIKELLFGKEKMSKLIMVIYFILLFFVAFEAFGDDELEIEWMSSPEFRDKYILSICSTDFSRCDRLLVPRSQLTSTSGVDWATKVIDKRINP